MTELCPEALRLLLRLLEAANFAITHATVEHYGQRGRELLESGLLLPAGHDSGIIDEDDGELHAVERKPGRGLGYYSPTQGWTAVEQEQLRSYRPDLGSLFKVLFADRVRFHRQGPQPLDENDRLWDMGTTYVGSTSCSVWFARRMGDERVAGHLAEVHGAKPPGDMRTILTTTERKKLAIPRLARGALVSIDDAMSNIDPIRIDMAILEACIFGRAVEEEITSAVFLSADNRTLSIDGAVVLVVGGKKQRRLLRLLVDAHDKGEPIRAAAMIERAGLAGHSFDKAFGHHWQILRKHMQSNGGNWSFVV